MLKTIQIVRCLSLQYKQPSVNKMSSGKSLTEVVAVLEKFAPSKLAGSWDNVGLLIEPYKAKPIKKIMLTNDLTEKVMDEAISKETNMIISYHPPIFAPLKRITQNNWKERIVTKMLGEGIALYSPHTAWDAVKGGVNDWLISALPGTLLAPIKPLDADPESGEGRVLQVDITVEEAVARVRSHIGQPAVQLALGCGHSLQSKVRRVAVCAGSGASVLNNVPADLYITGEMSHHELLNAQHQNVSVIVCNHSNTERGFLTQFQPILRGLLHDDCEVYVSQTDADPLVAMFTA